MGTKASKAAKRNRAASAAAGTASGSTPSSDGGPRSRRARRTPGGRVRRQQRMGSAGLPASLSSAPASTSSPARVATAAAARSPGGSKTRPATDDGGSPRPVKRQRAPTADEVLTGAEEAAEVLVRRAKAAFGGSDATGAGGGAGASEGIAPGVAAVDETAMEAVIAADSEKARTLLARELEEMVTREMLKLDALQLMVTVATVACIPPKRGW